MRHRRTLTNVAALVLALGAQSAQAAFVTSNIGFAASTVVDFSQFGGAFTYTTGPVQVGGLVGLDIEWSSTSPNSVIGNGGYGLGLNGSWNSGRNGYVGTNSSTALMRFDFNSGPVSAVGAFVNYAPGYGQFVIEALGAGDVVLESYNVTALASISTPGATNAGAFRGIVRNTNDIEAFRLSGAFDVADDLEFSAVPEPMTLTLLGLGLAGAGALRRRKTRA